MEQSAQRKSRRLSSPEPQRSAGLFPPECQICGKHRIQHKNVRYTPYVITSNTAAQAIKKATEAKDQLQFYKIQDLDLIAKEYHKPCYQNYTKGFSSKAEESTGVSSRNINNPEGMMLLTKYHTNSPIPYNIQLCGSKRIHINEVIIDILPAG